MQYRRIRSACGTQEHAGIWGTSVQFFRDKFDTRVVENHCIIELRNVVCGLVLADVDDSLLQPSAKKKRSAYNWARSKAKIPVDGWTASGILCHDMAIYQRGYAVYNEIFLQGGIQADQKIGILVHS